MTFGGSLVRNARFGDLTWDTLVGHSCGTLLWDHSCRAHSSYETSSKSHAARLQDELFVRDFLQKSRVKSQKRAFRTKLPPKVTQEFPTRVSHKSVPQECPTRVSYKSVPQECPTRVSRMSAPQECPTRVSRMSHKSVLQECPTRVSRMSVPQECPTSVSHKSVRQECPIRVTHKSVPQECATRVSRKSVL